MRRRGPQKRRIEKTETNRFICVHLRRSASYYSEDMAVMRCNIITQAPDAGGTMTSLGWSPALAEKDGWVYLVNQQKGMRVLDLDPVEIGIDDSSNILTGR